MKKHFSKLLTVVLALTMVLTMLNVSFAAAAPVEVGTADDLTAALANGGEIKLTGDITISSKLSIAADTVIEGAGHTLTYTGSDRVIDVPKTTNGADLTVNNLTIV
ncbi:MAG: hypothetical protein IJC25_06895, partial [Clostridia bacterium]|nr:hypothetical protein [Clostridia bacterium]